MFNTGEEAPPEPEPEERSGGMFSRLRESIGRSRRAMSQQLAGVVLNPADPDVWEQLELALIAADGR